MNITEKRETIKIIESIAEQKRGEISRARQEERARLVAEKFGEVKDLTDAYDAGTKTLEELKEKLDRECHKLREAFNDQSKVITKTQEGLIKALEGKGLTKSYYRSVPWEYNPDVDFSEKYNAVDQIVADTKISIWGSDSVILSEIIAKLKEI